MHRGAYDLGIECVPYLLQPVPPGRMSTATISRCAVIEVVCELGFCIVHSRSARKDTDTEHGVHRRSILCKPAYLRYLY
jgi:hypothetical protein